MHANKRERIEKTGAGDIVAVTGLKSCSTGDSICDPSHPILLEPIGTYAPVISIAVEVKTRADQEKLMDGLVKCPRRILPSSTRRTRIRARPLSAAWESCIWKSFCPGERDYHVGVNAGKPQVVYRETITEKSRAKGVFDREIGGVRHFGEVDVHLAPRDRGAGNVVSVRIRDGSIPESFHQAVEEGIWDAIASGPIMGYPMVG